MSSYLLSILHTNFGNPAMLQYVHPAFFSQVFIVFLDCFHILLSIPLVIKTTSQFLLPSTTVNFVHALRSRSKIDFRSHSRHTESTCPEVMNMHGNPLLVGLSDENSSLLLTLSWYESTEFKGHKESERFWTSLETGCPLAKKRKKKKWRNWA